MDDVARALGERRRMMYDWAVAWTALHEARLSTERVRFPVRVGGQTYHVTSEQALGALSRTILELDRKLATKPTWGADEAGHPCEPAMRGLINRRFASRLIDELRNGQAETSAHLVSLFEPRGRTRGEGWTLGDIIEGSSKIPVSEALIWMRQSLQGESLETREIVVRQVAGETADEISRATGLTAAAVRQRLSRFRKKPTPDLRDAALGV